jgi:hypothetical protein
LKPILVLLACTAPVAFAQPDGGWTNPQLSERGVEPGAQRIFLRRDLAQCHAIAFEKARGIEDDQKRTAAVEALFNRCMAGKGWSGSRPETSASGPASAPRDR